MVNKTIQQKDLKRKRRGKFRKHSTQFVNTGRGPAPGAVSALYKHKLVNDGVDNYLAAKYPQKYFYTDDQLIQRNRLNHEKRFLLGEKSNPFPLGEVRLLMRNLQQQMNETIMEN